MNLITKIVCLALLIGGSSLSAAQPVDCRSGEQPAPQGGPTGETSQTPKYPVRGTATIPTTPSCQANTARPVQQNQNTSNVNQTQNNNNANRTNVRLAPAAMNNGMDQGQTNTTPANSNSQDNTASATKNNSTK